MKNRTFDIFGIEYTIRYCKNVLNENNELIYGNIEHYDRVINISTHTPDNRPLPARVIKNTLLHELVHAILSEGQYLNCNNYEPLVE